MLIKPIRTSMLMNCRFLEQISCLASEDLLVQTMDCFAFLRPVVNQGCTAERSFLLLGKAFPTAFILYSRSQNSRLGRLTEAVEYQKLGASQAFSALSAVFLLLWGKNSVWSLPGESFITDSCTVPPLPPSPVLMQQSNFRETVCF